MRGRRLSAGITPPFFEANPEPAAPAVRLRDDQRRRRRIGARRVFLVEIVERLGVAAEELHAGDHVVGIRLLFELLVDEPLEEVDRTVILDVFGGGIDAVDERGDVLLMRERGGKRREIIFEGAAMAVSVIFSPLSCM